MLNTFIDLEELVKISSHDFVEFIKFSTNDLTVKGVHIENTTNYVMVYIAFPGYMGVFTFSRIVKEFQSHSIMDHEIEIFNKLMGR